MACSAGDVIPAHWEIVFFFSSSVLGTVYSGIFNLNTLGHIRVIFQGSSTDRHTQVSLIKGFHCMVSSSHVVS